MYYSLMQKMKLSFIDSDLLYRGAFQVRRDCIFIWYWSDSQVYI